MSNEKRLLVVGILLMFVGIILHIVGMATPEWLVCEYEGKTCYFDLWNNTACYDNKIKSVDPYEGEYPELTAVKGLVSTGLISGIWALGSALYLCTISSKVLKKIGSVAISLASTAVETGGVVYGVGIRDGDYGDPEDKSSEKDDIGEGFRFGYSFILCIVAGILMVIGGGIFFVSKRIGSNNSGSDTGENKRGTEMSRF